MKNEEIGLLVVGVFKLLIYLIFLTFYITRIVKLDKLASNSLEKDRSLKFRICCVLMLIALQVIHIVLSFADTAYYMFDFRQYSFIDILGIIDYILQLYIITREYKKKTQRSRSVVMMWIMTAISEISTIIVVEVYSPSVSIILPIFKVIITVVLIVLTFLVEPPPQASLENIKQSMRQSKLLPLISQSSSRFGKKNQRIYVEFNKQFDVTLQKDHYEYSFKIAVYIYEKFHIITKSQTQFIQLSKQMKQIYPNSDIPNLKSITRPSNVFNIMKAGQEKQKNYQSFLINITKNEQYYAEPLMNFLQIHAKQRNQLQKHKGSLLKKESLNYEDQEKLKKPFFTVSWKNDKIHVSNPQILDFYVNKSNHEIVAFHQRLLAEKKLKIQLLSEQTNESELSHFIFRVVNSKVLWRVFAQWMSLGSTTQDKIYNMLDFWNLGFHNLQMSVIGFQTSFDKNNSMIYCYLLSINAKNSNKQGVMLKKRFNDFSKLDHNIKKFILNENIKNAHIPDLPPRFSPFESKTSPNSRRVYFDAYIKDVIKIQGINHCVKLLQFLQVDKQTIVSQFSRIDSQQNQEEQSTPKSKVLQSIRVDDLQLDINI